MRTCGIEGCTRPHKSRGMCATHHSRWYRTGSPEGGRPRLPRAATPIERFGYRVRVTPHCWEWLGALGDSGYGTFGVSSGRSVQAHRFAYESFVGPIPEGALVDHRCRNRGCVNPQHLRLATNKQNMENLGAGRGASGVRGVYPHRGRWRVGVYHHGRNVYGGTYASIDEAESAAIKLRNELFTHNDLDRR